VAVRVRLCDGNTILEKYCDAGAEMVTVSRWPAPDGWSMTQSPAAGATTQVRG